MRYAQDFTQDLRYALRSLRQSPGFATVAILSAALGIGACSTIFGIANFALFSSLPVRQPDRLVALSGSHRAKAGQSLSYPAVEELQKAKSFQGVAAYFPLVTGGFAQPGGRGDSAPSRHFGAIATENFFDVAQVPFALGRGFDASRHERVIVLSHSLWRSRFQEDPSIAGRTILWNGKPVTVTGVTAPGFRGTEPLFYSEFWIPMALINDIPAFANDKNRFAFGSQWLFAIGRLRDGVDFPTARAELAVAAQRLEQQNEAQTGRGFHLQPAGSVSAAVQELMTLFFALLAAVTALVLLVASANVANLLLARGSQRERELATRLAVGAARGRLIRQLLTESLVLAVLGGLGGCALAVLAATNLGKFELPLPVPIDLTILLDYRLLLFSTGLALVTGLLFGAVPAWRATRVDLSHSMKLRRHRAFGLRNVLVVAQVAISMVLLLCSGLFLRSLTTARSMETGLSARDVLLVGVDPALNQYDAAKSRQFFVELRQRVREIRGVEDAAFTQVVPLSIGGSSTQFHLPGSDQQHVTDVFLVSPGYFATLGIPLRRGADFAGQTSDADTVVINEHAALQAFGRENALGRTLEMNGRVRRIVGITANSKSRTFGEEQRSVVYEPLLEQSGRSGEAFLGITLAVRTRGEAAAFTAAVRDEIRRLDPALAVFDVRTMTAHLEKALFLPRLAALMFGLCGAVALVISAIGLYGVVSFSVAQRTREIGIRMALGAAREDVLGWVLRGGLALAGTGIVLGLGAALGVSRVTASLLYGVSPNDPWTFALVPLFLAGVVALACWIPARRAASLDPARTLRAD